MGKQWLQVTNLRLTVTMFPKQNRVCQGLKSLDDPDSSSAGRAERIRSVQSERPHQVEHIGTM